MLYMISIILLFLLLILMPKTKEKLNIIKTMLLTFLEILAYNTLICYCLTFINIPITLINLSIINFIISIFIIAYMIKKKQIQKYYICKKDIIITIVVLFVVILMVGINFRMLTRIRYISMDAFQHYKAAREFSENTALFHKVKENSTTATSHMPMGYVNIGILFKILKPWIGVIPLYKVYILWESFVYFLVGIVFYFCIKDKLNKINEWLIGIIFLIFYLIGYPLNSLISGFHYLLIGILYFMAIFEFFIHIMPNKEIKQMHKILILTLFNLGLIFSYCLFCPFVYLAEFVYIIKQYKEDKNKKILFLYLFISLILTGLMGSHISIIERMKDSSYLGIQLEGWIYKNNWSNIILLLPFTIYYLVKLAREKGNVWEKANYIFFILFFILLGIGTKLKMCSSYYFYKNYYILWFLIFYTSLKGMLKLLEANNWEMYLVNCFTCFYVFLFLLSCIYIKTHINIGEKEAENLSQMMEIYTFNKTNMITNASFLSKEELELLNALDVNLEHKWKEKDNILIIGTDTHEKWVQALTGYYDTIFPHVLEKIEDWNNGKKQYLLVFRKEVPEDIFNYKIKTEQAEIIEQNDGGMLLKYKLEKTEK